MTTAEARSPSRTPFRRSLLGLEAFLAVGAYGGATALVAAGSDMVGDEVVAALPFASPVFAGLALAIVNGLLPTIVFFAEVRRARWAAAGHLLVGAALVTWIIVQVAFLGWPPHWLQITYFIYGWVIVGLAATSRARPPRP